MRPGSDTVHIELDLDSAYELEFREMLGELLSGKRRRSMEIAAETDRVATLAAQAHDFILEAITRAPETGKAPGPRQRRRLVHFLAALYEPTKFRLDVSDLRAMDPDLSRACIDCLNYYRLGLKDVSELRPDARETVYELFKSYSLLDG